jgi:polar amino acid transport system substrate-binding protein
MISRRLLVLAFALVAAGCAVQGYRPVVEPPPLRVGVTPDSAPYVFQQQDRYSGLEIEFARRIAIALGRRLAIVPVPWDEQIPALLAGHTDIIMSGMSVTRARAQRVAFGDPYLTTSLQGLVRREDAGRWPTPDDLLRTSPRIGVKKGTTGEDLVRRRRPDENIVVYRRSRDAINELIGYRIDVYVGDAPVIDQAVTARPDKLAAYPRVGTQSLAWAFRPDDPDLRADVNGLLARWRADGTLRRMLAAWPSVE